MAPTSGSDDPEASKPGWVTPDAPGRLCEVPSHGWCLPLRSAGGRLRDRVAGPGWEEPPAPREHGGVTDVTDPGPDPDFLEPPTELWMRIADAVVVAATEPTPAPVIVEYRIDGDDVVVEVGGSWAEFAATNDAPELADAGTGRTLWSSMSPGELRDLWQEAVARVRERGEATTVPFRCDGPGARRWFEMTITPEPDGHLRFRSEMTFEMERPTVAALGRSDDPATDDAIDVCSWCGKGFDGEGWHPVEEVLSARRMLAGTTPGRVRFGLCPACRDEVQRDLVCGPPVAHDHTVDLTDP